MAQQLGITHLADKLGIQPSSARVALRKAGIKPTEGRYAFKDKAHLDKVVGRLNTVSSSMKIPGKKVKGAKVGKKTGKIGKASKARPAKGKVRRAAILD